MLGRVYKQVNAAAGVVEEPGKIAPPRNVRVNCINS
jgi:hypothetical protein